MDNQPTILSSFDFETETLNVDHDAMNVAILSDRPRGEEGHCPRCGSWMYGRFEPLAKYGTELWCSACGYTWPHSPKSPDIGFIIEGEIDDSVLYSIGNDGAGDE